MTDANVLTMAAGGGGAVRATAKEQLERLARLQAELQAMPEDLEVTIQGTGGIEGGSDYRIVTGKVNDGSSGANSVFTSSSLAGRPMRGKNRRNPSRRLSAPARDQISCRQPAGRQLACAQTLTVY